MAYCELTCTYAGSHFLWLLLKWFVGILVIKILIHNLISAMIDSVGGPVKVNNLLTTLNLKPISGPNLKVIKRVLLCIIFFFFWWSYRLVLFKRNNRKFLKLSKQKNRCVHSHAIDLSQVVTWDSESCSSTGGYVTDIVLVVWVSHAMNSILSVITYE